MRRRTGEDVREGRAARAGPQRVLIDKFTYRCYFHNYQQISTIVLWILATACSHAPGIFALSSTRRRAARHGRPFRCSFARHAVENRGFLRRRGGPPLIISCKNSRNSGGPFATSRSRQMSGGSRRAALGRGSTCFSPAETGGPVVSRASARQLWRRAPTENAALGAPHRRAQLRILRGETAT